MLPCMSFKRRMRSLPPRDIKITDPFFSRWHRALIETTLPKQFDQLVATGRLANFARAAGKEEGAFEGIWFNDSDVYKFAEACAYALAIRDDDKVRQQVEAVTVAIVDAQMADGYVNTFFQLQHPDLRWRNLNMMHEMYCGGHLIEAGVAAFECLGDRRLLDVSIRFADHVMTVFGPDKRLGYPGHEEIEHALIRLAHAAGDDKYREFARWLVERRGCRPSPFEAELADAAAKALGPAGSQLMKDGAYDGSYSQDHAPIREHGEVVGHAVRAMYLYMAAADLADGQEDSALEDALARAWQNLTTRRMYITGGIGPSRSNEGFTDDYDLPNLTAYAETCAACGLVFWGQKMLEMTGDADYADVIERALYNGVLSGISLSGDLYFYVNPLESRGTHARVPWFDCACCPPNVARLIGSVGKYVLGASDDGIYIHIPVGCRAETTINGVSVKIEIDSDYPWSGTYRVRVSPETPVAFKLRVRIPAWSSEVEIDTGTAQEPAEYDAGYAVIERIWKRDDLVTVDLKMTPMWYEADPRVQDDVGRVALTNGPLVYALEGSDVEFAPQAFAADTSAPVPVAREDVLGGVNLLTVEGMAVEDTAGDELYFRAGRLDYRSAQARLIPYYAWNNRGQAQMQVWLRSL